MDIKTNFNFIEGNPAQFTSGIAFDFRDSNKNVLHFAGARRIAAVFFKKLQKAIDFPVEIWFTVRSWQPVFTQRLLGAICS